MENSLKELLVLLRSMQLYYHNCHQITNGANFVGDHSLFSDFYKQIEGEYDSVAERTIGLFGVGLLSLKGIIERVEDQLESLQEPEQNSPENMFAQGGLLEVRLQDWCDIIGTNEQVTIGTQNLIAQIADNSEARLYKIRQRLS